MTRIAVAILALSGLSAPVYAQGFCPHFGFVHPMPFGVPITPWGWGPVWVSPPMILPVAPQFLPFAPPRWELDLADFRTPEDPRLATARVDTAVRRGDLLVVTPNGNGIKQAGGARPVARPEPALPRPNLPPLPPNDPAGRMHYFVRRAKEAFTARQLGLATERLSEAIAAQPNAAGPHFLLAQVYTARGHYGEAVAAIRDGLRLDPNWPAGAFKISDFYGPNAEQMRGDLAELESARANRPDDPTLLFLSGYFRWFGADRDTATKHFAKAAGMVTRKDAEVIELFLRPRR